MNVTKVTYSKVFPLGNYSNEKLSVEIELKPEDNPAIAIQDAKAYVELCSSSGKQKAQEARSIIAEPKFFTGVQVENAKTLLNLIDRLESQGFSLSEHNTEQN